MSLVSYKISTGFQRDRWVINFKTDIRRAKTPVVGECLLDGSEKLEEMGNRFEKTG